MPRILTTTQSNPASLSTTDGNAYPVTPVDGLPPSPESAFAFVNVRDFGAQGDGVHDDTADVQAGLSGTAPAGQALWMSAGTYKTTAPLVTPTGMILWGDAGATLKSTVAPGGNALQFIPQSLTSGTVSADASVGSDPQTIELSFAPAVGHFISITRADTNMFFRVLNVAGAMAPYTVTVDRPFCIEWQMGDAVSEYATLPEDCVVEGNGMAVSGTGDRAILLSGVIRPSVRRLNFTTTFGVPTVAGFAFDGCQEVTVESCAVDLSGSSNAPCVFMQGCERGVARSATGLNAYYGVTLSDCYSCGLDDCWAYNCHEGLQLITLNAAGVNYGCIDCWVSGGGAIGCQVGLTVFGSTRGVVSDFAATYCSAQGVLVKPGPGGVPTLSNRFVGVAATFSTRGFWVQSGVKGTVLQACDVSGCGPDAGIWADDDTTIDGLYGHGFTSGIALNATAGVHRWSSLDVEYSSGNALTALLLDATSHRIEDSVIDMTGTTSSVAIVCQGGLTVLRGVTATGANVGLQVLSGAVVILGRDCDFSGCTNPIQLLNGGTILAEQSGFLQVPLTSANVTLDSLQQLNAVLEATGALTGDVVVYIPEMVNNSIAGLQYDLSNATTGAHTVTFAGLGGGPGVTVTQGKRCSAYMDGANNLQRVSPDT